MQTKKRGFTLVVAGFAAGVAFIVACEVGGPGSDPTPSGQSALFEAGSAASARHTEPSPDACSKFEVVHIAHANLEKTGEIGDASGDGCGFPLCPAEIVAAPDGWEPIGWNSNSGTYLFRRCAD